MPRARVRGMWNLILLLALGTQIAGAALLFGALRAAARADRALRAAGALREE